MKKILRISILMLATAFLGCSAGIDPEFMEKAGEDAQAQFRIGIMYENGFNVPVDYRQAIEWYAKAADQGYARAQNRLGFMYRKGNGVSVDYEQAIKWYTKAAEQGYAVAQYNLGLLYVNGQGVSQDYKYAYAWFSLAASQSGSPGDIQNRDMAGKELSRQQLIEAKELAAQIKNRIEQQAKAKKQN